MSAVHRVSGCEVRSDPRRAPTGAVVVVPAHDEERLLGRCLRAVRDAARRTPIPVRVVVVLDACGDRSADSVPDGMTIVRIARRRVGAARAAGFAVAAHAWGGDPARLWYATTDADSVVPPEWLTGQLAHADSCDVTVGTVAVDWQEHSGAMRADYECRYRRRSGHDGHGHIHGANLGVRADWYHRVGGFAEVAVDEDVDLVARLRTAGARVNWIDRPVVVTSDRRVNRVHGGFGGYLRTLAGTSSDSLRQG